MRVVIAGGHGKIALLLERLLAERGDQAVGLIRSPAQTGDLQKAGAEAAVCDLETASADEVAVLLAGADAVVFAAGAGPGSGAARKDTVDRAASVLLAEAAARAGVRRFAQVSSMGAGQPPEPGRDEVWAAYITAKTAAEDDLTVPGPGLDHPAPGRPYRRRPHRKSPARPPAGPPGHDPPRRRCRGHHRPARRAGHPAPDAGTGQWRHSDRRGGGQHLVSTTPGWRPSSPPGRAPGTMGAASAGRHGEGMVRKADRCAVNGGRAREPRGAGMTFLLMSSRGTHCCGRMSSTAQRERRRTRGPGRRTSAATGGATRSCSATPTAPATPHWTVKVISPSWPGRRTCRQTAIVMTAAATHPPG